MFPVFGKLKCGPRSEQATCVVCRRHRHPESAGGEVKRRILDFHHCDICHIMWSFDAA